MDMFLSALRACLVTFVLCGLIYPFTVTGLGQLLFPFEANGSLIRATDATVIGSALIGQQWTGPEWFHGRLSATTDTDPADPAKTIPAPYNAANSSGSNLGPTSKSLKERLAADRHDLEAALPDLAGKMLPADMLTTSASGLDPHITPSNAALQISRVAGARGTSPEKIADLLKRHIEGRALGVFGERRVNVLELNRELDQAFPRNPNYKANE